MSTKRLITIKLLNLINPNTLDKDLFYKFFNILICCFLAPFIIFWFVKELYLLAFIEAGLLLFFCCNIRQIFTKKTELLPRSVVLVSIGCQLLLLTDYAGSSAALWTYPLLATYFLYSPSKQPIMLLSP